MKDPGLDLVGGPLCGYRVKTFQGVIAIPATVNALNTGNTMFKDYNTIYTREKDYARFIGYMSNKELEEQQWKHSQEPQIQEEADAEANKVKNVFLRPKKGKGKKGI